MGRRFKNISVLMGGGSSEREVSLRSGKAVAFGLREGGYRVSEMDITSADFSLPQATEAVFIALHGECGEDGTVQQSLLERGIPYTGSTPESSRLSFDKVLTRNRLVEQGIPVANGELLLASSERSIGFPLVVKPPREGSSVGCHLVLQKDGWDKAFIDAAQFCGKALVEEYIAGRELTVGIVNGEVLPPVEIIVASDWYDYAAKYETGQTIYQVPAELSSSVTKRCADLALQTFDALGAEGLGRVDFRMTDDEKLYVLELNSIPGFTESSLLPKAAQAAGIGFSELCCRIIEGAHL